MLAPIAVGRTLFLTGVDLGSRSLMMRFARNDSSADGVSTLPLHIAPRRPSGRWPAPRRPRAAREQRIPETPRGARRSVDKNPGLRRVSSETAQGRCLESAPAALASVPSWFPADRRARAEIRPSPADLPAASDWPTKSPDGTQAAPQPHE